MDPNQGGQKPLNPNLQAAYDRVMGLDVSGNATGLQAPSTPSTPPTTPTASPSEPPMPTPAIPTQPTIPAAPQPVNQPQQPVPPPIPAAPETLPTTEDTTMPSVPPAMEAMNAEINVPQVIPHDTETVKIGLGGSPVGSSAKAKGKGISPVVLILGAFVFLIVYALFWVRFFNFPLPFLGK